MSVINGSIHTCPSSKCFGGQPNANGTRHVLPPPVGATAGATDQSQHSIALSRELPVTARLAE